MRNRVLASRGVGPETYQPDPQRRAEVLLVGFRALGVVPSAKSQRVFCADSTTVSLCFFPNPPAASSPMRRSVKQLKHMHVWKSKESTYHLPTFSPASSASQASRKATQLYPQWTRQASVNEDPYSQSLRNSLRDNHHDTQCGSVQS